jgi:hypothetical protein
MKGVKSPWSKNKSALIIEARHNIGSWVTLTISVYRLKSKKTEHSKNIVFEKDKKFVPF